MSEFLRSLVKQMSAAALLAAALAMIFSITWPYRDRPAAYVAGLTMHRPLAAARSWHYQLDRIDVDKLAAIKADVMVIDFAKKDGKVPLSAEDVDRLKTQPDGSRRYVMAYLSVGEGESFRSYWRPEWKSLPPDWLGEENCAWPKAHRVRYWLEGWKGINFRGQDSYLGRIISAGFDGVYLDRVDIYETFEKERPAAREEMIEHVLQLADTGRRLKPGFLIIPQNGEDLLSDARYRTAIDGLGKESLLYGLSETGVRNGEDGITWSTSLLDLLIGEGKPVFAVEYLTKADQIAATTAELRARGMVPTVQTRALDGGDPLRPLDLTAEIGTPERTARACPPGTSW